MTHISIAWCTFLCQREVLRQIRKRIVWGLVLITTHYQSQTLCRPLACSYCTSWSTNNEACLQVSWRNQEDSYQKKLCSKLLPLRSIRLWFMFLFFSTLWMWVRETLKGEIAFWSEITFWSMAILYTEPTIVRTSLDMITINHRLTNSW